MTNSYELEINFLADGSNFLKSQVQAMGYSVDETGSPKQISFKYFNLLKRLIPPFPRQVLVSKNFSCPPGYEKSLEIISNKIKNGEDLRPHLSKGIKDLDYKDILLNDWGIYHLHLGTTLDSSGFIKRTKPVLFARFDKERAFFIDIMEHGQGVPLPWIKQHLIRILHDNWPDSINIFRLDRIRKLTYVPSDTDIKDFRKAGIQTVVQLANALVKWILIFLFWVCQLADIEICYFPKPLNSEIFSFFFEKNFSFGCSVVAESTVLSLFL